MAQKEGDFSKTLRSHFPGKGKELRDCGSAEVPGDYELRPNTF